MYQTLALEFSSPSTPSTASVTTTPFGTLSMYDFSFLSDSRLRNLATAIATRYLGQFELTSKELLQLADSYYGNDFSTGVIPRPFLTELLQFIINLCIQQAGENHRHFDPTPTEALPGWYALLNRWGSLLPTHTLRDFDKVDMQQFSTPPEYALLAAWCCQVIANDVVLEPSAGLAGLASLVQPWAKHTVVNEFDRERADLLRQMPGWAEVLNLDAAMIHLHPFTASGKPTVVLMNPPFSIDRGEKDRMTAAKHIESALSILEPGGRLVAILPGGIERSFNQAGNDEAQFGMAPLATSFRDWWKKIMAEYTIRCNIGIDGSVYKKFGTGTRTRLVVIDNVGPQGPIEPITLVNKQTWVKSPLLLLHDNDFINGVVMSRAHNLSPAKRQQIIDDKKLRRQSGIATRGLDEYKVDGPIIKVTLGDMEATAGNSQVAGGEKGEVDPHSGLMARPLPERAPVQTTLVSANDQRGAAEQIAARIMFTLGLGAHFYEHDQFYAKLNRGEGLLPLVIERQLDEIYFTHWFEQNGDLCRDSEVRFHAPLNSGLLKLSGITGWGPRGEFHDECRWGAGHEKDCRNFAKMMLENVKHLLSIKDVERLELKCDDWIESDIEDLGAEDTVNSAQEQPEPADIIVLEAEEVVEKDSMEVFHGYKPFVNVTGSKPHNVTLVESNTMRLAQLPIATSPVHLPHEAVHLGHISSAQLENTIYAVHAHEQLLRDGITRKAYLIGDGTGVGKGTEAASVAMHYFLKNKGKVRVVWVSKEFSLAKDAVRDWTFIGGNENFVYTQDKFKEPTIPLSTGILFTTYTTMSMRGSAEAKSRSINRMAQIITWLHEGNEQGMDTLLVFDESHLMGNATTTQGARGQKKASQRAVSGMEVMEALPKTRVLFLSATAATEVHNLAYAANRLGLCGEGIPAFPDLQAFISKIDGGGMLAMELIAKDMKAMGLYNSRSLSYEGTTFRMLEHPLSDHQQALYNESCYFWRLCYDYMKESFEDNGTDGQGKALAMGQFWGGAQRFYNQILISMQTPTAIDDMLVQLETGNSVVIQLVNTNEAATNRVVAEALANDQDLDEIDITPRDMLLQLIRTSYPTVQYEKVDDGNGNTVKRPMKDALGDFVQNPKAVELRDELLLRVAEMRVPDGALDMVIERMEEAGYPVAEITGRSRRFVRRLQEGGQYKRVQEIRSKARGDAEAAEFMQGARRVLIFSGAGNTGRSFQSDLRFANLQRRIHYVLQPGWRADEAIQGLGRTHRTNQANAPEYVLVTTDLPGQKRFVTSIARRIEQLGSLTKGNRAAASNELFRPEDNLETRWAKEAVNSIFMGAYLQQPQILEALGPEVGFDELCDRMGFNLIDPETGSVSTERIPAITQFLNRVLFLPTHMQVSLFTLFEQLHTDVIESARANGLLDIGVEKIKADEVVKIGEQLVHADKDTGARTMVVQLECRRKMRRLQFEEAYQETDTNVMGTKMATKAIVGYYLSDNERGINYCGTGGFMHFIVKEQSQRVYAVWSAGTSMLKNGNVEHVYRLVGPTTTMRERDSEFHKSKHRIIGPGEAQILWNKELYVATDMEIKHQYLVTGAVMPVWEKLGGAGRKVRILVAETTDNKERILGRLIFEDEVDKVMSNLGATSTGIFLTAKQLVDDLLNSGSQLHLANGWQIRRRRLQSGRHSMVVHGPATRSEILGIEGLTAEVQGRDWVNVLATSDDVEERMRIFTKFVEHRPVVRIDRKGVLTDVLDKEAERAKEQASQLEHVAAYSFDNMITWHDELLEKLAKQGVAKIAEATESLFNQRVQEVLPEAQDLLPTELEPLDLETVEHELVPIEAPEQEETHRVRELSPIERALYVVQHQPKKKSKAATYSPDQLSLF